MIRAQIQHPCLVHETPARKVPSQLKSLEASADVLQCRCSGVVAAVIAVGAVVLIAVTVAAVEVVAVEQPVEWMLAVAMVVDSVGAESLEKDAIVNAEMADVVGAAEEPSQGLVEAAAALPL
jgi:cobalamin biosynthesis protein CobD/CbiB